MHVKERKGEKKVIIIIIIMVIEEIEKGREEKKD